MQTLNYHHPGDDLLPCLLLKSYQPKLLTAESETLTCEKVCFVKFQR